MSPEHAEAYRRVVAWLLEAMQGSRADSVDGDALQEMLVESGVFEAVTVTEECGEDCTCSLFGFPATCYRATEAGLAALKHGPDPEAAE